MRFAGHLANVVALAKTQVGYVERSGNRTKFGEWFGWNGVAWCAIYCSWLFAMTGYQLPPLSNSKGVAYVPLVKQRAQETGQWRGPSYNPKPGDLVIFWFTNRPDHIEVVGEQGRLPDRRVHTYGGNTNYAGSRTGGMCVEAYRRSNIHGFVDVDDLGGTTPPPYVPPATTPKPSPLPRLTIRRKPMWLIKVKDDASIYLTDGMSRVGVANPEILGGHQIMLARAGLPNEVYEVSPAYMASIRDDSSVGGVHLTVFYIRAIIDKIAKALKVPTS